MSPWGRMVNHNIWALHALGRRSGHSELLLHPSDVLTEWWFCLENTKLVSATTEYMIPRDRWKLCWMREQSITWKSTVFFLIISEIGWKATLERSWKLLHYKLCAMGKLLFKWHCEFTKPTRMHPEHLQNPSLPQFVLCGLQNTLFEAIGLKSVTNHLCHWAA